MGFILSYISLILFVIVYLLDEIVMLFVGVKGRKWYQLSAQRKYTKAFTVDVFGNYLFGDFWNFIWSKGGYKFGIFGETLSSCLGRKKSENTLNWFGMIFYYVLYVVDFSKWKYGGHCFNAIMSEVEIKELLKRR